MRVGSIEKGASDLASTGIFLLNPHKFKDEDFIVASDVLCNEEFLNLINFRQLTQKHRPAMTVRGSNLQQALNMGIVKQMT